ncbi:MAG: hypothetical protein JM58_01275 [Peptococcaceae bacterium BICA1-8]|nr:MAG: hypothetical protein JM58_01275 [Peptococcaceae bacterium BICA1-8]
MKKFLCILLITFLALSVIGCGAKQEAPKKEEPAKINYPTKPIEIIVPYAAGGGQDVTSRLTAKYMVKYLPEGAKVIVSNINAGGGVAGATAIALAKPDGYQIGALVPFQLTDQFIMKGIPYNENSFYPIAFCSSDGNFVVVRKDLGVKNMEEFIALAKQKPGEITMGMGGAWNVHDFLRLKLEQATGAQFQRMPFNGGALALAAVAGGNADSASQSISEALAAMEAGQVIALAVTDPERTPLAPEIPTLKESGIDLVHAQWRAFTVPPETPQEIKDILNEVFKKVFNDPEWIAEAKKAGLNPIYIGGQEAVDFYNSDFTVYKNLINKLGIQPQ